VKLVWTGWYRESSRASWPERSSVGGIGRDSFLNKMATLRDPTGCLIRSRLTGGATNMTFTRERLTWRSIVIAIVSVSIVSGLCSWWWRNKRKMDAAVEVAARGYAEKYGKPFPRPYSRRTRKAMSRNVYDEVTYAYARWDASKRAYTVTFVKQYVVNDVRDSWDNPVPFDSGATTVDNFLVREDGTCEHLYGVSGGEY
jgi:hypothetical protein